MNGANKRELFDVVNQNENFVEGGSATTETETWVKNVHT